jgi:scyllo-inosose 3-dehydrogenase
MKAILLTAEWAPRGAHGISPEDAERHWAPNANLAWRNPSLQITEVPHPGEPGPDEVLVKIEACGICGSDVHMYETDPDGYIILPYHVAAPVVTGHEFAGTVTAIGSNVRGIEVGEIVTVEEIQYCGSCLACRGGYPNSCERIEDIGFTINGGFAEYVRVPKKAVWSLNPLLDRYGTPEKALEVGAMSEPVSVSYEGMFTRSGGFKPGGAVAVFGAGPIGLAAVALAGAAGASVLIAVDPNPPRREIAAKLGATTVLDPHADDVEESIRDATRGVGLAMAVEASGNWSSVMPIIDRSLAVGGKVAIIGMDPVSPEVGLLGYQLKGASITGSVGHSGGWNFPNVINLMASGRIEMEHAVTKRAGLDGMVKAVKAMGDRTDGKVLIKPSLTPKLDEDESGVAVQSGTAA